MNYTLNYFIQGLPETLKKKYYKGSSVVKSLRKVALELPPVFNAHLH